MQILVVINDPGYGSERPYNAIRLAGTLARREDTAVTVFLIGDAVGCAVRDQHVPTGYYDLERMLGALVRHGGTIGCCGTCMDARGISDDRLLEGARRSSMEELADLTLGADRILTF